MKSSITVIIVIISNTIDKQSGDRGLHHLLDCRETAVVRKRWEINNVSGKKRGQKRNAEIKTLFGNTCCHTAAAHEHASYSVLSIRKGHVKDKKLYDEQPTSMKEIPTLQTSAWMPYCSPDILSG